MATEAVTAESRRQRHLAARLAHDGRPHYLIAALCGMPPNHLGGIITGRVEASPAHRAALAKELQTTVEELFPDAVSQ